jgi:hypothetical protein
MICASWLAAVTAQPARAMSTIDFLTSLSDREVGEFQAWRNARQAHEQRMDRYWAAIEQKRAERRRKRRPGVVFTPDDYVQEFPPDYKGPSLSADLKAKYDRFLKAQEKADPSPPRPMPTVADYLAAAKAEYDFVPERVSEAEFKRRYAAEAIALGLTRDQVVRVYALETGGIGTYDMQAGINPIRKTGRAISSALGYAQLLDANSVNEVFKSGDKFIARLQAMARSPNASPQRVQSLNNKIKALRQMVKNAKTVPYDWSKHQAYAKTRKGMGMHALNIDADIGPMLQAVKLKGVADVAAKAGRYNLTGAELEIMNLAGPATGLEMLNPAGGKAPTANFFSRRAYYVNKMVIGLTGESLLAELNRRMDISIKTAGSQEFLAAFDTVKQARASNP